MYEQNNQQNLLNLLEMLKINNNNNKKKVIFHLHVFRLKTFLLFNSKFVQHSPTVDRYIEIIVSRVQLGIVGLLQ